MSSKFTQCKKLVPTIQNMPNLQEFQGCKSRECLGRQMMHLVGEQTPAKESRKNNLYYVVSHISTITEDSNIKFNANIMLLLFRIKHVCQ